MSAPLTAVDLFAGAGGLALGTERAGFRHALLAEWDHDACETLRLNPEHPEWRDVVVEGDVRDVDFTAYRGVDLIAGGPPCQSFSMAGRRKLGKAALNMFPAAVQAIADARPRAVLLENVTGLVKGDARAYFDRRRPRAAAATRTGHHGGVPQRRRRPVGVAGPDVAAADDTRGARRPSAPGVARPFGPRARPPTGVRDRARPGCGRARADDLDAMGRRAGSRARQARARALDPRDRAAPDVPRRVAVRGYARLAAQAARQRRAREPGPRARRRGRPGARARAPTVRKSCGGSPPRIPLQRSRPRRRRRSAARCARRRARAGAARRA